MIEFTLLDVFKKHSKDQQIDDNDFDTQDDENYQKGALTNLDILARKQQELDHGMTRWQGFKTYKAISFYVAVLVWTMILWGYENQAGGMVISIPQFRKDFGYAYGESYVLPVQWQSAISGGPQGSVAIGSIVGSLLADRIGKRRALLFASLFSIPWITLEFVAVTIEVFFVGKLMNAFCLGIIASCAMAYTSEIAPLPLRSLSSGAVALALCIGPFCCVLINNTTSTYTSRMAYRGIFIPQWIFAVISVLGQCFIPESPYWLIAKGRDKGAVKELKRMYSKDIKSQYALMKVTVEEASLISSQAGTYLDCFKKKDLRRTLLVIFPYFMQTFGGVGYVTNYSTYYYQVSGYDTKKSFQIACGAQAMSVFGVFCSFFIVDRLGRRPSMMIGMTCLTLVNLMIAVTGLNLNNRPAVQTSAAFMAMYNFFYNIGIGALPYILGNEISSIFLRVKSIAIANFINNAFLCMWTVILPYMFNPDEGNMGSAINFIFTGFSFISLFIFWLFLPETSHRYFEEIDELFALGVNPRKWRSFKTEKQVRTEEVTNPKATVEFVEKV
ncbi:alpha-glucosides permease Mph3p [[Candida] jaroonii]|uniref:Alpha-glucosides permease Mph3p n=1 Tax=[Candida] jaroonii TaxID=467808 RepID=A0ACA9Y0Z7_9ASCO|nr:alpha-glucosides permease Mph3p [[Candida] jaroonii]